MWCMCINLVAGINSCGEHACGYVLDMCSDMGMGEYIDGIDSGVGTSAGLVLVRRSYHSHTPFYKHMLI